MLIWVFAGRTYHFVGFVMRRPKCVLVFVTMSYLTPGHHDRPDCGRENFLSIVLLDLIFFVLMLGLLWSAIELTYWYFFFCHFYTLVKIICSGLTYRLWPHNNLLIFVWNISSGLRVVQELKISSKYRDCLKILRIVICKHKDLVVV